MKNLSRIFASIALILGVALAANPLVTHAARTNVTDWYIDRFESDITINTDGSLNIKERITADCGKCKDKHGIFRVLPYEITTQEGDTFPTPITLYAIEDEKGNARNYSETIQSNNKTISWRIGDADKTVQGVNIYDISYTVQNAIRDQEKNDEFYWNLVGAFWDLEIDHAVVTIHTPELASLNGAKTPHSIYAGPTVTKDRTNEYVQYKWTNPNTLVIESKKGFKKGEDVTASLSFPKGVFALPNQEEIQQLMETMSEQGNTGSSATTTEAIAGIGILWVLPSLIALLICYPIWRKKGKDPVVNKAITPEFTPPNDLSALMIHNVETHGKITSKGVTAGIVDLAVNGLLVIKEIPKEGWFGSQDFSLSKTGNAPKRPLDKTETALFDALFEDGDTVLLSSLKTSFPKKLKEIHDVADAELIEKGFVAKDGGQKAGSGFFAIAAVLFFIAFLGGGLFTAGLLPAAGIFALFGGLMMKRTQAGAELIWKISGFKLFMNTAEKYRQQFFEKEGMFEKLLPYAILFGITKEWLKKMGELGVMPQEGSMAHPWFVSAAGLSALDSSFDTFAAGLESVSSSISTSTTSSSGSSGGGFSGGGGGGGGGGGW